MNQPAQQAATGARINLLCFEVAERPYAIDALQVREIRRWSQPADLPDAPSFVLGVINLRGTIIPVYDLKARFGQGPSVIGPYHVLLIVEVGGRMAGLVVDRVVDLIERPKSDIQPVQEARRLEDMFIADLVVIEDKVYAILTLDCVLDVSDRTDAA